MDKVCIFIDGSNFYYQLKEEKYKGKTDYGKLAMSLVGETRKLIRCYYYVCPHLDDQTSIYHEQQKFFTYLQNTPYLQLEFGRLEQRGDSHVEKGVDVKMAVDMVALAYSHAYDVAILVTNDADLSPAVQQVKQLGKQVEYAYIARKTGVLAQICDRDIQIDLQSLS
jgi:uncharacterized LabA/DUF88 family protein